MSLPTTQPIFDDHERPTTPTPGSQTSSGLPPIRRRRGRRPLVPEGAGPRLALLERLAYRITPSLDFYLILLVSGIVLGAALLFNSPALMVLAALLAPFVAPPISLCLAAVLGSGRHFLYTLLSGLVGYILILLCGLLAGLASSSIPQPDYAAVSQAAEASWPGFVLVSAGTILTILSLIRTEQKPLVPSVALAYALYLPVGAAGFGLTSGIPGLWPQGLLTSVTYLVWAVLLGAIVLSVLGFWPRSIFGVVFEAAVSLASLTILLGLGASGGLLNGLNLPWLDTLAGQGAVHLPILFNAAPPEASPTGILSQAATGTPRPAQQPVSSPITASSPSPSHTSTPTRTFTPAPPTATPNPTYTLVPSLTPTLTLTIIPTPVWAMVDAQEFDGAYIREEPRPDARIITSVLNGTLVEVLTEVVQRGSVFWVHVRTIEGVEGWIVQSLLMTATPAPNW